MTKAYNRSLSFIIPCYNCQDNILLLLQNISKQFSDSLELVLVNDGSTDDTKKIISQFIKENPHLNINFFSGKNQGAAKARQKGLDLAKGEYIFFIDADDEIASDFVSTVSEAIKENPDMIYFSSVMKEIASGKEHYKVKFDKDEVFTDHNAFLKRQLEHRNYTAAVWTYVFRKSLLVESGAHFTDRKVHEDHLFTIALIAHSKKIMGLSKTLYTQIRSTGSLTTSKKKPEYAADRYVAYKECYNYMKTFFNHQVLQLYKTWSLEHCNIVWNEILPGKMNKLNFGYIKFFLSEWSYILKK